MIIGRFKKNNTLHHAVYVQFTKGTISAGCYLKCPSSQLICGLKYAHLTSFDSLDQ